jgi:hypothetical protein
MKEELERYQSAQEVRQDASTRLRVLQAKALHDVLTEKEETEQLRLERRVENLEPVLARLEREARFAQDVLDIDAVTSEWGTLAEAKRQAYEAFREAVAVCRQTYLAILAVHAEQEHLVLGLPRGVQEKLQFPDPATLAQRIAGRMPVPMGWDMVLSGPPGPLQPPDLEAVADVDPGTKELNPKMIQRFLEERQ